MIKYTNACYAVREVQMSVQLFHGLTEYEIDEQR